MEKASLVKRVSFKMGQKIIWEKELIHGLIRGTMLDLLANCKPSAWI